MNGDVFILHDNDLDGYGAAVAARAKYGEDATYLASSSRQEAPEEIEEAGPEDTVILLDNMIGGAFTIADLVDLPPEVLAIDHHESDAVTYRKMAGLNENSHRFLDSSFEGFEYFYHSGRSAAVLAWTYFLGTPAPPLLKHVQDYDLWRFEMDGTDEITEAMKAEGLSYRLYENHLTDPSYLRRRGTHIVRARDQILGRIARDAVVRKCQLAGQDLVIAFANNARPVWHSKLGERLLSEHPEADLAFMFEVSPLAPGRARARVSMRSRPGDDGPDVGEIGRQLGGGGHPDAAGCELEFGRSLCGNELPCPVFPDDVLQ